VPVKRIPFLIAAVLILVTACTSTATPTVDHGLDRYEPNDTRQEATFMHDLAVEAYISRPDDVDVFMTPGTYGGYLKSFTVELYDLPADYDLYVYDSATDEIARSTNRGLAPEYVYHDSGPRTGNSYWLKVVGVDGACDPSRPYRLRFTMNPKPDQGG
jgi:bacillolysin